MKSAVRSRRRDRDRHLRLTATLLHEILPNHTNMPTELIIEGLVTRPNHVFVIPPQWDLHVLEGAVAKVVEI